MFGAACTNTGVTLDAKNDTHCAAVGYVFFLTGEEIGDRGMTKRSKTLYQWYMDRMRDPSGDRMSQAERRTALLPVVKSITGGPEEYVEIAADCARRAAADPAFELPMQRLAEIRTLVEKLETERLVKLMTLGSKIAGLIDKTSGELSLTKRK